MIKKIKSLLSEKPFWIASVCVLLLTSLIISGALLAKYVHSNRSDIVAGSPNFYFNSDYLTENPITNPTTYYLKSDTESITFTLTNYDDELRFSDDDVAFSLTVTCLTDPADTTATLSQTAGDIATGAPNEVAITLSGIKSGYSYQVVALGSAGFRKTLNAVFTVQSDEQMLYKYLESENEYVILTVWTRDVEGSVNITFPEELIPDNTWPGMETIQNAPKIFTVNYGKYTSQNYRFFKKTLSDEFSAEDFDVILGETEAQIKSPS